MKAVEANRDSFFGPIYLSIFFAITIAKRMSPAIESSVNRVWEMLQRRRIIPDRISVTHLAQNAIIRA